MQYLLASWRNYLKPGIFSGALDYIDSPNKNVEVIEELVAFVFKQFDQGAQDITG
ncbi:MAG: hypothetical protein SFT91_02935 [Rickettsiaceae bacterium]|nr:hypothetical protein [Rickettsiaceae bacterium]